MRSKLQDKDLLEQNHFPVIAFFNAVPSSNFMRTVEQMSAGIGTGINSVDCSFPDDVEEDEEKFDGVRFSVHDEEVVINYETFYYYLNLACKNYVDAFPDDRSEFKNYLTSIREQYNLHQFHVKRSMGATQ